MSQNLEGMKLHEHRTRGKTVRMNDFMSLLIITQENFNYYKYITNFQYFSFTYFTKRTKINLISQSDLAKSFYLQNYPNKSAPYTPNADQNFIYWFRLINLSVHADSPYPQCNLAQTGKCYNYVLDKLELTPSNLANEDRSTEHEKIVDSCWDKGRPIACCELLPSFAPLCLHFGPFTRFQA